MIRKFRSLTVTVLVLLFLTSGLARIVSASLATLPDQTPSDDVVSADALLCPPSTEVADLLRQIRQRDAELSAREERVALREQDVRVARQEVLASLDDLTDAQTALEALMYRSDTASETDIARLTTVYEGMKPKDAAVLFEAMETAFASGFLARMRPDAASAIFTHLSPEKAYAVSVMMAGRNANAATE